MRYTFTSEFLKVVAPATSFGEAWELLCLELLRADTGDTTIQRLAPPDRGVDILSTATRTAYQCKSSERGVFGSIAADPCLDSIDSAKGAKSSLGWESFCFAVNAPFTGAALSKIYERADFVGVSRPAILPPEHWSGLCEKHPTVAARFLDYRMLVTEAEVIDAFRKARYYDNSVQSVAKSLRDTPLQIYLKNNRTPLVLSIPFSADLTIEKLLDAAQQLMGIKLDWVNFPDLGTSCGPSLSITVDRKAQSFSRKLSELSDHEREKLELWIKLVWRDELESKRSNIDGTRELYRMNLAHLRADPDRVAIQDRGQETLKRTEALVQNAIWRSVSTAPADSA
jgi:hypothetical protein